MRVCGAPLTCAARTGAAKIDQPVFFVNDSTTPPFGRYEPLRLLEQIMDTALRPLADPAAHPESFFEDYRLLGLDGSLWSIGNVPALVAQLPGAAIDRFRSAVARVQFASVAELCTRAPLAVIAGRRREGGEAFAERLWVKVPDRSIVVADELFATPRSLFEAHRAVEGREIFFLASVRDNVKVRLVERLSDGSAWVEAPIRGHSGESACLRIRELRAMGRGPDHERFTLRLWTTLADTRRFPAAALARRYAVRWRHELYHRDLKLDVHHVPERTAHDFETAAQEIAALLLGSWALAQERLASAERRVSAPSWVSFLQLMRATETLWSVFRMLGGTLSQAQRQRALDYYMTSVRSAIGRPDRGAWSPYSSPRGRAAGPDSRGVGKSRPFELFEIEVVPI